MEKSKFGILVSSTQQSGYVDGYKNIGDYTQSLAQLSFFDSTKAVFVDKERISEFRIDEGPVKVILNAWMMVYPDYWPPSDDIEPLMISVHISPTKAEEMLSPEGIKYLKEHGPIGCRDLGTVEILKRSDIPCYYSGCLTLTLGQRYKPINKNNDVIFVDPYIEAIRNSKGDISIKHILSNLFYGLAYMKKIKKLEKRFKHFYCVAGRFIKLKRFISTAAFYRAYSNKFSDDILFSAKYITQSVRVGTGTEYTTEMDKLKLAEDLVQTYADAALVITSRIHCALPCLAIGIPSLFVHTNGAGHVRDPGRFGGLLELFNILEYGKFNLVSTEINIPSKIHKNNIHQIQNKNLHLDLASEMVKRCKQFVQQ